MAKILSLLDQILKVTKSPQKRNEDVQAFLARQIKLIDESSDDEWDSLSPEGQDWYNKAADQLNAKQTIDLLEPEEEEEEEEEEVKPRKRSRSDSSKKIEEEEEEEEEVAPKKKSRKKIEEEEEEEEEVAPKKKSRKKVEEEDEEEEEEAAPKPKKNSRNAKVSITGAIRDIICEDQNLTKEEVAKELKAMNITYRSTTLDVMYNDTHRVLVCLKKKGMLKK